MRVYLVKLVMFIAFLAAVSCDKSRSEPQSLPAPAPTSDGLELLSTGSAGQRLLRYKLADGTSSTLELRMEVDLATGAGGTKLPQLDLVTRVEIVDVRPNGAATLRTTILDAKMIERPGATLPLSAVGQMAEQLKGVVTTATIAPDGTLGDTKVDTSKVTPSLVPQLQQLTQTFEQIAMPLPATPIGVGGSWTTRKQHTQNGLAVTTVTTIKVTSIDGDRIGIASQSTLTAPDQTIDQAGTKVDVKDIGGSSSLSGTIDLAKVTLVGESTSEFRGSMSSLGQQIAMRLAMKLTFTAPDR
ncbi:MAG: hypothetical protein H0V17_13050 [Deltaproteobacteria bacterium]|nr:hypothetical protein [Deltaproteobacteria bacterium]